jgi:hypothetical protein
MSQDHEVTLGHTAIEHQHVKSWKQKPSTRMSTPTKTHQTRDDAYAKACENAYENASTLSEITFNQLSAENKLAVMQYFNRLHAGGTPHSINDNVAPMPLKERDREAERQHVHKVHREVQSFLGRVFSRPIRPCCTRYLRRPISS